MRIRTIATPLALTGVLVLAGCGSSDSGANTAGDGGNGGRGGDFREVLSAYVACLQENGVTVTLPSGRPGGTGNFTPPADGTRPSGMPGEGGMPPSGAPGGMRPSGVPGGGGFGNILQKPDGVSQKKWDAARDACASKLPQGQFGPDASAPAPNPSATT
jgi:hypothetical protein